MHWNVWIKIVQITKTFPRPGSYHLFFLRICPARRKRMSSEIIISAKITEIQIWLIYLVYECLINFERFKFISFFKFLFFYFLLHYFLNWLIRKLKSRIVKQSDDQCNIQRENNDNDDKGKKKNRQEILFRS